MNCDWKIGILILILPLTLYSQKPGNNLSLRFDGNYGFVLPEYQHFNYLVEKPILGFELSLTKKTTGKPVGNKHINTRNSV